MFYVLGVDIPESSSLTERTFEAVVIPDSDEIHIPGVFVSRWKEDLAAQKYGWIKDPAGNYIRIDLTKVVEQNMIPGGVMISRSCGFVVPQTVVLCYQIFDNQFNMRIVDDGGLDVPYFGFHYPTNHHARRVADPFYVCPRCFVSAVDSPDVDGSVGLAVPSEMFKDYVGEVNAFGLGADFAFEIPDNDVPIHIPAADGEPEEYIWTLKVTRAVADGRSVLHFPRYVIERFDFSVGTEIDVTDDATGEMFQCKIKTSTRPSGYVMKYLSQGWYHFVRSKELNPGDRIVFSVVNPVADMVLRIHRA